MGKAIGNIFGGGGGSGRDTGFQAIDRGQVSTPAFNLETFRRGHDIFTNFAPTNTIFQQANRERFPRIMSDIDTLRTSVRPFASDIRRAGLGAIAAERSRSLGTLRESLARRGVLGSSFANDARARAAAEFAKQEAEFEANVGMQEFQATQAILDFEQAQIQTQLTREFQELGIAANFATSMASTIAAAQNTIAQIDMNRAALKTTERGQNIQASLEVFEKVGQAVAAMFGSGAASSREIKDRIGDGDGILDGLERLEIHRWRYKGEETPHVGPYAEDFRDIFGVGDGKTLHLVDVMGVTLGAIKELAAEVRGQKNA